MEYGSILYLPEVMFILIADKADRAKYAEVTCPVIAWLS